MRLKAALPFNAKKKEEEGIGEQFMHPPVGVHRPDHSTAVLD